jgi:phospholipase C
MDGFAIQAETVVAGLSTRVMSAFRPEVIPVHTALAMNFAVFDRWYSSVPTSTQPNRLFVHSATSHGLMSNLQTVLAMGLPQQTIMDDIADAGLSFGVYYQNVPTTLFFSNMRKLKYVNNFMDYDAHFHLDAAMGNLPNYVVVEQRYYDLESGPANDDHPSHDIAQGQALIKDVYETLRASPQWNELLLLITYDEHGGFYDHVPTPQTGIPAPENFNFDRLGVRVPTIAVSPWINQGTGEEESLLHLIRVSDHLKHFWKQLVLWSIEEIFGVLLDFMVWVLISEKFLYVCLMCGDVQLCMKQWVQLQHPTLNIPPSQPLCASFSTSRLPL